MKKINLGNYDFIGDLIKTLMLKINVKSNSILQNWLSENCTNLYIINWSYF